MAQPIPDINLFTQPRTKHLNNFRSTSSSKFRDSSFDSYAYSSNSSNFNRPRSYKWDKINNSTDYYLQAMKMLSNSRQLYSTSSSINLFGNWKSKDQVKQHTKVLFSSNLHKPIKNGVLSQQINKQNQPTHFNQPQLKCQAKIKSFPQPYKVMVNQVTPRFTQQIHNPNISKTIPNLLSQQKNLLHVGSTPLLKHNAFINTNNSGPLRTHNPNLVQNNPQISVSYVQRPIKNKYPINFIQNIPFLGPKIYQNNQRPVSATPHQSQKVVILNRTIQQKQNNQNSPIAKVANQLFETEIQSQSSKSNFYCSLNQTTIKIVKQINKMENTLASVDFKQSFSSQMSKAAQQVQAHLLLDQLVQMKNDNIEVGNNYISQIDEIINRFKPKYDSKNNALRKEPFAKNKKKIQITGNSQNLQN